MPRAGFDHHPATGRKALDQVRGQLLRRDDVAWQWEDAALMPRENVGRVAIGGEDDFVRTDQAARCLDNVGSAVPFPPRCGGLSGDGDATAKGGLQKARMVFRRMQTCVIQKADAAKVLLRHDVIGEGVAWDKLHTNLGFLLHRFDQLLLRLVLLRGPCELDAARVKRYD